MIYNHSIRDRSTESFIANSMSIQLLTVYLDPTVSLASFRQSPYPTWGIQYRMICFCAINIRCYPKLDHLFTTRVPPHEQPEARLTVTSPYVQRSGPNSTRGATTVSSTVRRRSMIVKVSSASNALALIYVVLGVSIVARSSASGAVINSIVPHLTGGITSHQEC